MEMDTSLTEFEFKQLVNQIYDLMIEFLISGKPFLDYQEWETFEFVSFTIYIGGKKIDKYSDLTDAYTKLFGDFQKCFLNKDSYIIGRRYELIDRKKANQILTSIKYEVVCKL